MELTYNNINIYLNKEFEFSFFAPKRIDEETSYFRFKLKDTNLTFNLHCNSVEYHLQAFKNASIHGSYRGEFERIIEIIQGYLEKNLENIINFTNETNKG